MRNIFEITDEMIFKFVSEEDNSRMKLGTGAYSTLFRSTLFGEKETTNVMKKLETNEVKVLWFGSNPNVPKSLELIKENSASKEFAGFLSQKDSKYFSEVTEWNPFTQWSIYSEIIDKLYGIENTLMANYVPWGSSDFESFVKEMKDIDRALFLRVMEFSNSLAELLIDTLKPKLVIIPRSIRNYITLCNDDSRGWKERKIVGKVSFIFQVGVKEYSDYKTVFLICPHPSYAPRIGKDYIQDMKNEVVEAIKDIS